MAGLQNGVTALLARAAREGAVRNLMAVGDGQPGALRLSEEQARAVVRARGEALQAEGLVEAPICQAVGPDTSLGAVCGADGELGRPGWTADGGAVGAVGLARGFADSPYVDERTYAQVLCDLQPVFCALRRQCGPQVSDAELVDALRAAFDSDEVAGCVELLADRSLEELAELASDCGGVPGRALDGCGDGTLLVASARDEAAWFGVPDERAAQCIEEDELPRPWNEDEWVDRFDADGWDGERWCEAHGFDRDDLR